MITLRHRNERGSSNANWLQSYHSFSFANYFDHENMGFGPLRVINEDRVMPTMGFGPHAHSNMEIISYVLHGTLEHKDSMGNRSVIRPGEIQRMSAGTGVVHSEFNPSQKEPVHFLQIWFLPELQNIEPSYAQQSIDTDSMQGNFKLVLSRNGREGSVDINQNVDMYIGRFDGNSSVYFAPSNDSSQWVQIVRGSLLINGERYFAGDGIAIRYEKELLFDNAKAAEVILFDIKN